MNALFNLIDTVLALYSYALLIWAIMSWLIAFNVINTSNQFIEMVGRFLYRITEPALRPIRRFMPNLGGIDLSPMILFLLIFFLRDLLRHDLYPMLVY